MGPIGLHGGGEFRPGDETCLRALLDAAARAVEERRGACVPARTGGPDELVRVAILPTAAARQRPDLAIETGVRAFRKAASVAGVGIRVEGVPIVDRASAESSRWAGLLAGVDIVYLTGGDPDVIPTVIPGTLAERALQAARARGAVVAGASAGAMALASWTWTGSGRLAGLGLVRGLIVVPHFERQDPAVWRARLVADGGSGPLGFVGLEELTGILSGTEAAPGVETVWRVAGAGRCHWYPASGGEPVVVGQGAELRLVGSS